MARTADAGRTKVERVVGRWCSETPGTAGADEYDADAPAMPSNARRASNDRRSTTSGRARCGRCGQRESLASSPLVPIRHARKASPRALESWTIGRTRRRQVTAISCWVEGQLGRPDALQPAQSKVPFNGMADSGGLQCLGKCWRGLSNQKSRGDSPE